MTEGLNSSALMVSDAIAKHAKKGTFGIMEDIVIPHELARSNRLPDFMHVRGFLTNRLTELGFKKAGTVGVKGKPRMVMVRNADGDEQEMVEYAKQQWGIERKRRGYVSKGARETVAKYARRIDMCYSEEERVVIKFDTPASAFAFVEAVNKIMEKRVDNG